MPSPPPFAKRLAEHLAEGSGAAWLGQPVAWHDALASTNESARDWAACGAPEGALVGTDDQTAGRGRLGRTWHAEPGQNVTASLVLRPPLPNERVGLIALATGLAVADALSDLGAARCTLKWPNDVLLGGRKVCGILVERRVEAAQKRTRAPLIVGIGLNVNQRRFAPDLAARATSLALATGCRFDRADVLARVLVALERHLGALYAGAFASVLRAYTERLEGVGETVSLSTPEGEPLARGILRGVDERGGLLLGTPGGLRRFHAGEVTMRASTP